jgi:hypothetical protein
MNPWWDSGRLFDESGQYQPKHTEWKLSARTAQKKEIISSKLHRDSKNTLIGCF